jgi:hypothetical protein
MLWGAVACFALGLLIFGLSRAGFIAFQVTKTNLLQIGIVSLLLVFFAFALPPKHGK